MKSYRNCMLPSIQPILFTEPKSVVEELNNSKTNKYHGKRTIYLLIFERTCVSFLMNGSHNKHLMNSGKLNSICSASSNECYLVLVC